MKWKAERRHGHEANVAIINESFSPNVYLLPETPEIRTPEIRKKATNFSHMTIDYSK